MAQPSPFQQQPAALSTNPKDIPAMQKQIQDLLDQLNTTNPAGAQQTNLTSTQSQIAQLQQNIALAQQLPQQMEQERKAQAEDLAKGQQIGAEMFAPGSLGRVTTEQSPDVQAGMNQLKALGQQAYTNAQTPNALLTSSLPQTQEQIDLANQRAKQGLVQAPQLTAAQQQIDQLGLVRQNLATTGLSAEQNNQLRDAAVQGISQQLAAANAQVLGSAGAAGRAGGSAIAGLVANSQNALNARTQLESDLLQKNLDYQNVQRSAAEQLANQSLASQQQAQTTGINYQSQQQQLASDALKNLQAQQQYIVNQQQISQATAGSLSQEAVSAAQLAQSDELQRQLTNISAQGKETYGQVATAENQVLQGIASRTGLTGQILSGNTAAAQQALANQAQATNAMVAAQPPPAAPSGGKYLCTMAWELGLLPDDIYKLDQNSEQFFTTAVKTGYRIWAKPVANWLKNKPFLVSLMLPVIRTFAYEISARQGLGESTFKGRWLLRLGTPVFAFIGKILNLFGIVR